MSLTMTYLTLKKENNKAKYIIFPRIDQKTCLKSIVTSGMIPLVLEPIYNEEENCIETNVSLLEKYLENGIFEVMKEDNTYEKIEFTLDEILCISSTTSCFAPRAYDHIIEISKISKLHNIPHIINNAYGIYCSKITDELNQSNKFGRIDAIISSTDKNLMTPVGGSFIYSRNKSLLSKICKNYPGRASISPITDVFITLLEVGKLKYKCLMKERVDIYKQMLIDMEKIAEKYGEKLIKIKRNKISIAMTLDNTQRKLNVSNKELTYLGGMFFNRQISGIKIIVPKDTLEFQSCFFRNYGCHTNSKSIVPMVVFAVAIGLTNKEAEEFKNKFQKVMDEFINHNLKP